MTDGPSRSSVMRRRLRAAFTERLGYKAAALFFALVLWLVVSAEEPAEQLVPVRLSLTLDSALELRGERPQLRALVVGRGRDLIRLFENPPVVRRAFGPDAPGAVRIALRPADVELPPGVAATVRDVQPRSVTLRFMRRAAPAVEPDRASLPVDSTVDPLAGDTVLDSLAPDVAPQAEGGTLTGAGAPPSARPPRR